MSKRISLRISEKLDSQIAKLSEETGESKSTIIRQVLFKYLDKQIYKEDK